MEILAPAGSIPSLKAAILAGCNAVYLGVGELNARAKCGDFSADNIADWTAYAHLFGVKVYVTLNVSVRDDELVRISELIDICLKAHVDAIIASDIAVIKLIKLKSTIPIHVSTQAGVQNSFDAQFFNELGAKRAVLARETLESDICSIKAKIPEVEVFVHGALCVGFSGACLLGSKLYGCSGNRGLCNQGCRLFYKAKIDNKIVKEGYLLSPYDLSKNVNVLKLEAAGVDSCKIEGRLKRNTYVYDAVRFYYNILNKNHDNFDNDFRNLNRSFNRGYTDGYASKTSKKIIDGKVPSHLGEMVGIISKIDCINGYKYAHLLSTHHFIKGDGAKIIRNGKEIGGSEVTSVKFENGMTIIPVSNGVLPGDEVHLTTDAYHLNYVNSQIPKLPIKISISGTLGEKLTVEFVSNGISAITQSNTTLVASNGNNGACAIVEKLSKLGDTDFYAVETDASMCGNVFIPISEINQIKRNLAASLKAKIIEFNSPKYFKISNRENFNNISKSTIKKIVEIEDLADMQSISSKFDAVILSPKDFSHKNIVDFACNVTKPAYLRLPKLCREYDLHEIISLLNDIPTIGIYADNFYAVELARINKRNYIAGFGLNIASKIAASEFNDADAICWSVEDWTTPMPNALGFVGKIPLMHFAHCPVSVSCDCDCETCSHNKGELNISYLDESRRELPIRRIKLFNRCRFSLYDEKITSSNISNGCVYSLVMCDKREKEKILSILDD